MFGPTSLPAIVRPSMRKTVRLHGLRLTASMTVAFSLSAATGGRTQMMSLDEAVTQAQRINP